MNKKKGILLLTLFFLTFSFISKPAESPRYVKFRLSYHFGTSKADDVYRIGADLLNESVDELDITKTYYPENLTHAYVCTYEKNTLLSLVHSGEKSKLGFINFSVNALAEDYTLELKQGIDATLLLTFTKGTCETIEKKMYLVEKYGIPTSSFSSFSYPELKEFPVLIWLKNEKAVINSSEKLVKGDYRLCLEWLEMGLGGKPVVGVKRC